MNKVIKIVLFYSFVLFLLGCSNERKSKYLFLNSENTDSLITGTYMLENTDSAYIRKIFEHPYRCEITHLEGLYGKSVYMARMEMLQKISNLKSPKQITHDPDSIVINFYQEWAIKSGYLKR